MKRLLKIGLNMTLLSLIPILSWFLLGLLVDKSLINVFALTYPLQFLFFIFKSIFAVGANISKEKDGNKNAVMSGMFLGIIASFIVFAVIVFNIDSYINFMHMDPSIYREFAIYSVIQIYLQIILAFILEKLYYEEKNNLANKYSIIFNILNITLIAITSLIFKDKWLIVVTTLLIMAIYTLYITIKSFENFKLKFNIFHFIKYDSSELLNNIFFFLIFLFGFSKTLSFGPEYTIALTFVSLITDCQWDVYDVIITVAQIDIAKNKFNFKEHLKNAYKFFLILLSSIVVMFMILYWYYDLVFYIVFILLMFNIINMAVYPLYKIKNCYLQLEYSPLKMVANRVIASGSRLGISFWQNPYCTGVGHTVSSVFQLIIVNWMFNKNYHIRKDGTVEVKA